MRSHHEVERTYAVGPEDALPDLGALPGVASVSEPRTVTLVATYVDTDDLALVRSGVTLRRRTGGDDEGWHLKVPAGDGRDELHRPLGTGHVPVALARIVLGRTRGRDLVPVATVETQRTIRLLSAADGTVLAEVADDAVVGTPVGGTPVAWRELEIELVGGDRDLLDAADGLLAAASDVHPSAQQRKIGAVLAERLATFPSAPEAPDRDSAAGPVLHSRLHVLVAALLLHDGDVRRGVPDGVHQLRVTCRRLRGALATYGPLLDAGTVEPLREELRWLARALGDGRDAEVLRERLRGLVRELPADQVVGPVRRRIDRTYAERLRVADRHAQQVLGAPRHLDLLGRLERLVEDPPWTDLAAEPAEEVLLGRVAKDWRRLRRAVDRALDEGLDDEALHDARKAAKRLRYACEALEPGWGKDAKRLRKAAQELTRVLGERQDSAVGRADLRRIAQVATAAGESAFTYGVLHAREEDLGRRHEQEFTEVWHGVRSNKLRAWLP
ncbi:MAG: domain containing protein [Nocardioides sp.]|nr:domain containing protein [Nocardioides sp.]